jgi:hypothetical protein
MRTSGLLEGGLQVVAARRTGAAFGFEVFETFLVRSVIATLYIEVGIGIVQENLPASAGTSAFSDAKGYTCELRVLGERDVQAAQRDRPLRPRPSLFALPKSGMNQRQESITPT